MDTFVLRNFETIALNNDEILKIDIEDFWTIINDDMLNVKNEEYVWKCCLRWIDFDPVKRKGHIAKLLSGVRLGLLNIRVISLKIYICNTVTTHLRDSVNNFIYNSDFYARSAN